LASASSVQPAGQGIPHREDRREHDIRRVRLSQHRPRFSPENRKANQALVELLTAIADRKKATPAQVALAWLLTQKPWIVPIPGTTKVHSLQENVAAGTVELTPDDIHDIETAASQIDVQGARYPEASQRMINR
jgi:aryl-alcohol dehydrogenase-like predicted oxidoreductase